MFTEPTTFRPRNGLAAEAYWRIRAWCEKNGFSFSDVLNGLLPAIAYYLENHCIVEPERSRAVVILNAGEVEILHVFGGKCYPLASSTTSVRKESISLEDMQLRVAHWEKHNAERPEQYDLMILPKTPKPTSTNAKTKTRSASNK